MILGPVSSILVLLAGCGSSPDGLRGASYEIPVYPDASVTESDRGGFSAGDDMSSLQSYDYVSWTLETSASMDEVVEFYKAKYPREVDEALAEAQEWGDEEVVVNFKVPEMGPQDHVELTIAPGEISIMQVTLRS